MSWELISGLMVAAAAVPGAVALLLGRAHEQMDRDRAASLEEVRGQVADLRASRDDCRRDLAALEARVSVQEEARKT